MLYSLFINVVRKKHAIMVAFQSFRSSSYEVNYLITHTLNFECYYFLTGVNYFRLSHVMVF